MGDAFDIVGERTQTDFKRLGDKVVEETFKIVVRNRDLIKQNGSLVYQQLFNGKILVLINYPYI